MKVRERAWIPDLHTEATMTLKFLIAYNSCARQPITSLGIITHHLAPNACYEIVTSDVIIVIIYAINDSVAQPSQ